MITIGTIQSIFFFFCGGVGGGGGAEDNKQLGDHR